MIKTIEIPRSSSIPSVATATLTPEAISILNEAGATLIARAAQRDQPEGERSMASIVKVFNAYTGRDLIEAEGWAFMIFLKMVRAKQGNQFHRDDYIDMASYSALLGECQNNNTIQHD